MIEYLGENDYGNFIGAKQCFAPTEMRPFHKYPFAPLVYFFIRK
jgi:hypothetical protein